MSRHRFVLNVAAAMATVFALAAAAMAADMRERPENVLELQPGMTKIVPVRTDAGTGNRHRQSQHRRRKCDQSASDRRDRQRSRPDELHSVRCGRQ